MSYRQTDRMRLICDGCGGELVEDSPANVSILIRRVEQTTTGLDLCHPCVEQEQRKSSLLGRFLSPHPFHRGRATS